jgi:hypothetical protein
MVESALELLHLLPEVSGVLLILLLHGGDLALCLVPLVIRLTKYQKNFNFYAIKHYAHRHLTLYTAFWVLSTI